MFPNVFPLLPHVFSTFSPRFPHVFRRFLFWKKPAARSPSFQGSAGWPGRSSAPPGDRSCPPRPGALCEIGWCFFPWIFHGFCDIFNHIHMGNLWETYGNHLGNLWKIYGKSVEIIWGIYGKSMGNLWETHGNHLGNLWKIYGKSVEIIWGIYGKSSGKSMGNLWKSSGKSVGNHLGNPWEIIWGIYGKSMGNHLGNLRGIYGKSHVINKRFFTWNFNGFNGFNGFEICFFRAWSWVSDGFERVFRGVQ